MRKLPTDEKEFEADTETTNVVMHKDSMWNKQWETFKNSSVGESNKSLSNLSNI